jgi:hypothetical protein
MTDEEIINTVLKDMSENEQVSSTPPNIRTIQDAMSAFNTCYSLAEESNMQTEEIFTLKRLYEKVLKEALRNKRQKITLFLCKNAVK